MGKINGINHITFATLNLTKAIAFYTQILGCELIATWEQGAYLLAGELWLCLSYDPQTKTKTLAEYTHIAFNVTSQNFAALAEKISQNAIPIWKNNKSEGESLYILDPDYNKLEIHVSDLKNRLAAIQKQPYSGMKLYKTKL